MIPAAVPPGVAGAAASLIQLTSLFVLVYYLFINGNYLFIHLLALLELDRTLDESRWEPAYEPFASPFLPGVAVVVPAYNESANIVASLRSMLAINYPSVELVVVNDGSTDETLAELVEAFDLVEVDAEVPVDVPAEPIRAVYRSEIHDELVVVDKENGGKSDALNAGIWLTDMPLFCAVDADTLIERDALLDIVRPFLRNPEETVAVGGTIRVVNGSTVENGIVTDVGLSRKPIVGLQTMEYLRAFYSGRLGLSRIKGLILISGAFGVFRTDAVREVGGYRTDSITEDFDLVVRLHKHLVDAERTYDMRFLPDPVAWTEVPESRRVLGRQRRRWYRGMVDTLVTNRELLFRRKYGRVGLYVLPVFLLAEALGPLIEGFGYVLLPIAWLLGIVDATFVVAFFVLTSGVGVFLSWFGVFSEVWTFNRYDRPREVLSLLGDAVLENVGYRQWKTLQAWRGLSEYLRGVESWGVMERTGFGGED